MSSDACQWCGDYSHGHCTNFIVTCLQRDDKIVRNVDQCPPSTERILFPVFGAFFGVTVLVVLQHLFEMRFDRVPANVAGELDEFAHLAASDRRLVAEFAPETIRYADYARKVQRDRHFLWLLGLISGGVVYAIYYQERLAESGWLVTFVWIASIVFLLALKAMRKTSIYVLTDENAIVISPRYLGVCGRSYQFIMAHRMTAEVYLLVRPDGIGSVYFAHENALHSMRANDDDLPDGLGEPGELTGFMGILRANEVYELVSSWRATRLGQPVPTGEAPRPPKRDRGLADRLQTFILGGLLVVFLAVFAIITMLSDPTATKWLFIMTVPYGLVWLACAGVYFWRKYQRWQRKGYSGLQTGILSAQASWSDDDTLGGAVGTYAPPRPRSSAVLLPSLSRPDGDARAAPRAGGRVDDNDEDDEEVDIPLA